MAKKASCIDEFDASNSWSIDPYQAWVFADTADGVVPMQVLSDHSIAANVDYITQFVNRLIRSKHRLLSLTQAETGCPRRMNTKDIGLTKAGECFFNCLRMDLDRIIDKYPDIGKFNRYFGLFYDAVIREMEFTDGADSLASIARSGCLNDDVLASLSDRVLEHLVGHANDAIDLIRQKGSSRSFKAWRVAIERQAKENESTLLSLIDAALSVNHHILVLRFDLGYGRFYCDPELSGGMAVTYEEMREHRVALRRFVKRDLKNRLPPRACKGMVSAVKLEFGLDKTFHFHVFVILNGDAVRKDGHIAEMICDQWTRIITKGRGGACNCNQKQYRDNGIGSIRRGDAGKLNILKTVVVPYITKADFYGKMVKPDSHRTFWSSQPPKIEAKPKGRQRRSGEAA